MVRKRECICFTIQILDSGGNNNNTVATMATGGACGSQSDTWRYDRDEEMELPAPGMDCLQQEPAVALETNNMDQVRAYDGESSAPPFIAYKKLLPSLCNWLKVPFSMKQRMVLSCALDADKFTDGISGVYVCTDPMDLFNDKCDDEPYVVVKLAVIGNQCVATKNGKGFVTDGVYLIQVVESDEITGTFANPSGEKCTYNKGKPHSFDDAPAYQSSKVRKWYADGQLHRDGDKPAVVWRHGALEWWSRGKRHRDNGKFALVHPCRIRNSSLAQSEEDMWRDLETMASVPSHMEWWWNGQRHRVDNEQDPDGVDFEHLPAVVSIGGNTEWWYLGERHRPGGLAAVQNKRKGVIEHWLNGERQDDNDGGNPGDEQEHKSPVVSLSSLVSKRRCISSPNARARKIRPVKRSAMMDSFRDEFQFRLQSAALDDSDE